MFERSGMQSEKDEKRKGSEEGRSQIEEVQHER